jgi:hypothetical protein
MKTILIGIDPDLHRCGMAWKFKSEPGLIDVQAFHFYDVLTQVKELARQAPVKVYVDAGWLVSKSNWHKAQGPLRRERIAKNVGECHAVGKLIVSYLERKQIPFDLVKPNRAKTTPEQFKAMKVWQGRINQDQIDAVMLILGR